MWHLTHLLVRPIEAFLGFFCVLTAIVLYPNEEGQIQSKFEDFWIKVDDIQHLALSRHAAFMQQVAKLEWRFLDRVFGHKLFSGRAIGVSISCSIASLSMASAMLDTAAGEFYRQLPALITSIVLGAVCILVRQVLARTVIFTTILGCLLWWSTGYHLDRLKAGENLFLLCALGLVCDVIFIAATRQILRLAGEMTQFFRVVLVVMSNLAVALCLSFPFLYGLWTGEPIPLFPDRFNPWPVAVSGTNLFDAALAFLFVFLALILLIHRAVWPFLTRSLFRIQDIGTKGRRAILTAVGVALLGSSIFGGKFPELLKDLAKIVGG